MGLDSKSILNTSAEHSVENPSANLYFASLLFDDIHKFDGAELASASIETQFAGNDQHLEHYNSEPSINSEISTIGLDDKLLSSRLPISTGDALPLPGQVLPSNLGTSANLANGGLLEENRLGGNVVHEDIQQSSKTAKFLANTQLGSFAQLDSFAQLERTTQAERSPHAAINDLSKTTTPWLIKAQDLGQQKHFAHSKAESLGLSLPSTAQNTRAEDATKIHGNFALADRGIASEARPQDSIREPLIIQAPPTPQKQTLLNPHSQVDLQQQTRQLVELEPTIKAAVAETTLTERKSVSRADSLQNPGPIKANVSANLGYSEQILQNGKTQQTKNDTQAISPLTQHRQRTESSPMLVNANYVNLERTFTINGNLGQSRLELGAMREKLSVSNVQQSTDGESDSGVALNPGSYRSPQGFAGHSAVSVVAGANQAADSGVPEQVLQVINGRILRGGRFTLQLNPVHLGALEIQVATRDNETSITLVANQMVAKEMLEQSLVRLRQGLQDSGVNITDIAVKYETSEENSNTNSGARAGNNRGHSQDTAENFDQHILSSEDIQDHLPDSLSDNQSDQPTNRGLDLYI